MKAMIRELVRDMAVIIAIIVLGIVLTNRPGKLNHSEYTGERIYSTW